MIVRLDKTLADYVAIAISPVLIMTLVGSLVFFLLEVFYQGDCPHRLQFILAMFVMATVLIGRISIEAGSERAALFALPLAVVTAIAIFRFVTFSGGPLASFNWAVNLGLMGLIWWCAHKLTWDCTLIDETEDASGEGILQAMGLDEVTTSGGPPELDKLPEPEGVTSRDRQPPSWWERLIDRTRRPHAPGVWIVYFSLAALPIFGFGQSFVPPAHLERRRYVFWLLCVYVASGLGLLLTTSFLGLRRYLRQRRLQMPVSMAKVWVGFGCAMIVALLVFAALLPRPGSEYPISELPFGIGSPHRKASPYSVGEEGTDDEDRGSRSGKKRDQRESQSEPQGEGRQATDGRKSDESGDGTDQGQEDGRKPAGSRAKARSRDDSRSGQDGSGKDGSQERRDQENGDQSGDRSSETGSAASDRSSQHDSQKRGSQQASKDEAKDSGRQSSGGSAGRSERDSQDEAKSSRGAGDEKAQDSGAQSPEEQKRVAKRRQRPSFLRRILPTTATQWITMLFRWLFYGVLIAIAGFWLWRSWEKVVAALRGLVEQWRALWERLFGSQRKKADDTVAAEEARRESLPRPFSAFVDPFAAGIAGRWAPDELVRYSFEALEAWAQERGWPREPEQTPHEFAKQVGAHAGSLSRDARRLADLYCQVAYAPGTLPAANANQLRRLWRQLESG